MRFIDIGANMTDEMFRGIYNGKQAHTDDLDTVLERAWSGGVEKIIVTCGNWDDIQQASELVKRSDRLYHTVGVHPTRCSEFESNPTEYLEKLIAVTQDESKRDKIVAIGEFGLDYDRVNFCPKVLKQHACYDRNLTPRICRKHNRNILNCSSNSCRKHNFLSSSTCGLPVMILYRL